MITSGKRKSFSAYSLADKILQFFRTLFTTSLNKPANSETSNGTQEGMQFNGSKSETLIIGVSAATMNKIIRYAYLRDVSGINQTNVVEMMMATDYLGVLGLMKYCINFIIQMLSPQNCVIFWLMAR